jgi:glycerophosphoryl diester phosphodiesterase
MISGTASRPLIIAHRGARSLAPENTIAAARKALELGADMWELDVGMTADGKLLVIHDSTLTRTSNAKEIFPKRRPWSLHEFTLEDLGRLDFGTWFIDEDPFGQIAAGTVSPTEAERYHGEAAPTLRQALGFTRDRNWRVNAEIKDLRGTPGDPQVVPKVVALLEELDMVDRVLVSSFNHRYLKEVRERNPGIVTGALVSKPQSDPESLLHELRAQAYHPSVSAIRRSEITRLRKEGFQVNVWTVNEPKVMKSLIKAGASGIFTDFPQLLKPLVSEL